MTVTLNKLEYGALLVDIQPKVITTEEENVYFGTTSGVATIRKSYFENVEKDDENFQEQNTDEKRKINHR